MPPSPPAGHSVTPLRDLWLPVTVHVAWTLVKRGYTVSPDLLGDAREHLLRGLPAGLTIDQVEWLTPAWVDNYLARRVNSRVEPAPAIGPEVRIPAHDWRDRLLEDADRGMEAVFRFHYAEGMSLDKAAHHLRCASRTLDAARTRLRSSARTLMTPEVDRFPDTRDPMVDTLLRRLATLASRDAPGPMGLMSSKGLARAETCPRTSRAVRLIRSGHLDPRGLFPPADGSNPTSGTISVICLLVHPDARRSARNVAAVVGDQGVSVGSGVWLLPADAEASLYGSLAHLCEKGRPARHHVRATRSEGSGRWSGRTLLGPVANAAVDATRAVPWGDVCGRPPLPLPAPPPPSANRWWAAALISAAATITIGVAIAQPAPISSPTSVDASFSSSPDGWDVRFDVPDRATLDVVVVEDQQVRILHRSLGSVRGAWATGDGAFRAKLPGDQVALLASRDGIHDLERLVLDASQHPDPISALEQMVRVAHPRVGFARSRAPLASVELAGPVAAPL